MIINDLDGYYIVFDTKNWNTELDTLVIIMPGVMRQKIFEEFYWNISLDVQILIADIIV